MPNVEIGTPTDACSCGSRRFVVKEMRLVIRDVPLVYDGSIGDPPPGIPYNYDDTEGLSDGWDRVEDGDVRCAACGKRFKPDIETDLLVEEG
jgi:DNA-directed RNA polymerase subunit RPC12/RpoP